MIAIALVLGAACGEPKIVNRTPEWNLNDRRVLKSARGRCRVHYPDSPCLKVFIKKADHNYNAVCGKPEEK